MLELAIDLLPVNDVVEAEKLAEQSVAIREKKLPKDDWRIASARSIWGECLTRRRAFEKAETLLVPSFRAIEKARGGQSETTDQAIRRIVELYEAWGKPELAQEYRTERVRLADSDKN